MILNIKAANKLFTRWIHSVNIYHGSIFNLTKSLMMKTPNKKKEKEKKLSIDTCHLLELYFHRIISVTTFWFYDTKCDILWMKTGKSDTNNVQSDMSTPSFNDFIDLDNFYTFIWFFWLIVIQINSIIILWSTSYMLWHSWSYFIYYLVRIFYN